MCIRDRYVTGAADIRAGLIGAAVADDATTGALVEGGAVAGDAVKGALSQSQEQPIWELPLLDPAL